MGNVKFFHMQCTVISSMRVDNWKGEGKHCPITCQVTTEKRLRYGSNHTRPWWQKGVGGQPHALASFPGKETWYLLYRRLGGPGAGLDGSGKSRTH